MKALKSFPLSLFSAICLGCFSGPANAEKVIFKLINGDSISGKLLKEESTGDIKVILHDFLGKIELKTSFIVYPKIKTWSSNFEFGLDGSSTQLSNSLGYLLEINTKYQDKKTELNLGSRYDFKQTSEAQKETVVGVNKSFTKIRYDRSIGDLWTSYFSTDYEYNSLNKVGVNDVNSSAGIAYALIKNNQIKLRLSAGPSLEWIDGGGDCYKVSSCGDMEPGASFGTDFKWAINKKLEFLLENKYNNQFSSYSYVSNRFLTTIRFFPSSQSDLYTTVSYENIYDQIKEPSEEHIYRLKLGTKF